MKKHLFVLTGVLAVVVTGLFFVLQAKPVLSPNVGTTPTSTTTARRTDDTSIISSSPIQSPGFDFSFANVRQVVHPDQGEFISPQWSPTNSNLLSFTKQGYRGLWLLSLTQNRTQPLIQDDESTFGFTWTLDGTAIYYLTRRGSGPETKASIKIVDVNSRLIRSIDRPLRGSLQLQETRPGVLTYWEAGTVSKHPIAKEVAVNKERPFVYERDERVFVFVDGRERLLTPGVGRYFLPILSPDATKVLYSEIAGGLYVTKLDTSSTVNIGRGGRGAWSPDSQYVVYDQPKDDGHAIIASDLYIADLEGHSYRLTETSDLIERNPSWSPDGRLIAFDAAGSIYVAIILKTER